MYIGIRAGCASEIRWDSGEWLIANIGFSAKRKTCGLAKGGEKPRKVEFGELVCLVAEEAGRAGPSPLNLLLEAPLSVAFNDRGNPTPRRPDLRRSSNRYWYVNAGAVTLVAAGHLLRGVQDCGKRREMKLFEGFVSFKDKRSRLSHADDVRTLRNAIKNPKPGTFSPRQD